MVDPEVIGKRFYNLGVAIANAVNTFTEAVNTLAKSLTPAVKPKRVPKLKSAHTIEMDIKAETASNNWRKMHGYPLRRKMK